MGIFRLFVLAMGTPSASGECHATMSKILEELEGCLQIKDDILIHGKGVQHNKNLEAMLKRLKEYDIRLRREKCEFGKQSVKWFGNIY